MILIDNRQNEIVLKEDIEKIICEIIEHTLKEEEVTLECEVSVIFINNDEIKEMNTQFRSIAKETDVLSFPMLEYEQNKVFKDIYKDYSFDEADLNENRLVLGDIALSLEKAQEQAIDYGHSFTRELCYLVVHSVLHLLGYDHMNDSDKNKMRSREEEILSHFHITR